MKRLCLFICFIICFAGSKAQHTGIFVKKGKDFLYKLELRSDSTFKLDKRYFEANSSCAGTWSMYTRDSIQLKCLEQNLSDKLSSGYLNKRIQFARVSGRRHLVLGNVRLTRLPWCTAANMELGEIYFRQITPSNTRPNVPFGTGGE